MKEKASCLLLLILVPALLFAAEAPPAEMVSECADFSKSVALSGQEIAEPAEGKKLFAVKYSAPESSRYSLIVAAYERGTLFGDKRESLEKVARESAKKFRDIPGKQGAEFRENFQANDEEDGTTLFVTVAGVSPSGTLIYAWSTLPDYDLLVGQMWDGQDGTAPEKKLKDGAKPKRPPSDIFRCIKKNL